MLTLGILIPPCLTLWIFNAVFNIFFCFLPLKIDAVTILIILELSLNAKDE